jgi:hypothetical protein
MDSYLYISANKLRVMGALDASLLDRLNARARLGIGPASVELGLDSRLIQALDRSAAKVEKRLLRQDAVKDVAEFASGPPPAVYFYCHGPASRAVISDTFWVAGIDDDVAVLLVGSASNAVAARPAAVPAENYPPPTADPIGAARSLQEQWLPATPVLAPDAVFGPAADPKGAARYLLDRRRPETTAPGADATEAHTGDLWGAELRHADTLASAWRALMNRSLELTDNDPDGLPRVRSLSAYVARQRLHNPASGWQAGVRWLVLGTPLYVAQVG